MVLVEKITRKIEIDEADGSNIHIRETLHLLDDATGEIVHANISHHRRVVTVDDDTAAAEESLTDIANAAWTPQIRVKARANKRAMENESISSS